MFNVNFLPIYTYFISYYLIKNIEYVGKVPGNFLQLMVKETGYSQGFQTFTFVTVIN